MSKANVLQTLTCDTRGTFDRHYHQPHSTKLQMVLDKDCSLKHLPVIPEVTFSLLFDHQQAKYGFQYVCVPGIVLIVSVDCR